MFVQLLGGSRAWSNRSSNARSIYTRRRRSRIQSEGRPMPSIFRCHANEGFLLIIVQILPNGIIPSPHGSTHTPSSAPPYSSFYYTGAQLPRSHIHSGGYRTGARPLLWIPPETQTPPAPTARPRYFQPELVEGTSTAHGPWL